MSVEMNNRFKNDPLEFMNKYAVDSNNDIGAKGTKVAALDPGGTVVDDYVFNEMANTHKVGYLDFNKQPRARNAGLTIGAGANAPAGLVCIKGSFLPDANMVKSYYLPWVFNGIVRLSIPAMGTALQDDDTKIFFTAAITGCSIFVKGTPQAPIIYHAGGNTHTKNAQMGAQYWREMMTQDASMLGAGQEVNKTHYIVDSGALEGDKSTAHSRQFETWLKGNATGDLNIEETAATGCVMGIRDLRGDWSFYLQENITITHSKFKKNFFGKLTKKTVNGSQTMTCRPMLVRKFFPGGFAGHANFQPSMPRYF